MTARVGPIVAALLLAVAVRAPVAAEVSASQAATPVPEVRTEVADPMQLVVSLGADKDAKGNARAAFDEQPTGKARSYPEVDRFVCDQARVRMLTVKKVAESEATVTVEASLLLVSEWPLQDVDLTVALVAPGGDVVGSQTWKALTLGAWSHSYTPPKATFAVERGRWSEMFAGDGAPAIRVTVDIVE